MHKWIWVALLLLPLAVAGSLVLAKAGARYACPVTGEELPCPACCPLNQGK